MVSHNKLNGKISQVQFGKTQQFSIQTNLTEGVQNIAQPR